MTEFFFLPKLVFAQVPNAGNNGASGGSGGSPCPPGYENLCKVGPDSNPNLVANIVQFLIVIAIVVSIIFVLWGGIKWITSGGVKGKVEQARGTVTGAVVGLIIALLAYAIVSYVVYLFTGNANLNFTIPRLID